MAYPNTYDLQSKWLPPFTAKRYLHPPFAEYMLTMWPDLRVMCGEIKEITCHYHSSAFRILHGDLPEAINYANVEYETRPDGVPIHAYTQTVGACKMHMESFGSFDRREGDWHIPYESQDRIPTAYSTFTLRNDTDHVVTDRFAILARTGREDHLVGMEVDGYAHYDNNVYNWGFQTSQWDTLGTCPDTADTLTLSDGEYYLCLQNLKGFTLAWQGDVAGQPWHCRRILLLSYTLQPGESLTFEAAFRIGDKTEDGSFANPFAAGFDLAKQRTKTEAFWLSQLDRVRVFPGQPEHRPLVNSMFLQCLQMFCYPVGKNYVLPRQGGLQRVIWPCEAMEFLMALDRLGDFDVYTETAFETYFFQLQNTSGDRFDGAVSNLSGNQWGSITGGSCWSLGYHLIARDDPARFAKYRDKMVAAFRYMERQRDTTRDGSVEGVGLFPAMQSCDWPGVYQNWSYTDPTNLMGYRWLRDAFRHFGDPMADEIAAAHDDYESCIARILDRFLAENDREDEILLPSSLGVPMTDPPSGAYFADGPGMLLRSGIMKPDSEGKRLLENFFRNRCMFRNGLTGLMNDGMLRQGHNSDPYAGHTWYIGFSDQYWYYAWLENGEYDKARETLEALIKWGATPEYYLLERYADNDPYWVPWMPNASGNGRLLNMLADSDRLYK